MNQLRFSSTPVYHMLVADMARNFGSLGVKGKLASERAEWLQATIGRDPDDVWEKRLVVRTVQKCNHQEHTSIMVTTRGYPD